MPATHFHLVTDWTFEAPVEPVWQVLMAPEDWPSWWRAVAGVERLAQGDATGVGAVRRITWRTALPYTLTFAMRITRVEPMTLIGAAPRANSTGSDAGRFVRSGRRLTCATTGSSN